MKDSPLTITSSTASELSIRLHISTHYDYTFYIDGTFNSSNQEYKYEYSIDANIGLVFKKRDSWEIFSDDETRQKLWTQYVTNWLADVALLESE
jgi:hypothetical protein